MPSASAAHPQTPPEIESRIELIEEILAPWRETIAADFDGYRNHVYRVAHFCFGLRACSEDERERVVIATCFHDLGIWSATTADYLAPSEDLAAEYLTASGRAAWVDELRLMIGTHHKLRPFRDERFPLVELLRRADLVDVSLGVRRFGLTGAYMRSVKTAFPNAGFHQRLVKLFWQGLRARPLRPVPVVRW